MLLLSCKTNFSPCPVGDQLWLESSAISSAADIGITHEQILYVISWGFGVVLTGYLIGYVLGLALGLIDKN